MTTNQDLQVGDIVSFEIDGKLELDRIAYMDSDVIEGDKYDLTFSKLKKIKSEQEIDKEATDFIAEANRKAETFFYEKAKSFPQIYTETLKEAFSLFYLEGYVQGYKKTTSK